MAESKFSKCILGCRGKCRKHCGVTATAVMGDVTQYTLCTRHENKDTRAMQTCERLRSLTGDLISSKCTFTLLECSCYAYCYVGHSIAEHSGLNLSESECFLSLLELLTTNFLNDLLYSVIYD